jgi:hypothetical protein
MSAQSIMYGLFVNAFFCSAFKGAWETDCDVVVARIRDSANPDSILNANFAGEQEDSNPKLMIRIF